MQVLVYVGLVASGLLGLYLGFIVGQPKKSERLFTPSVHGCVCNAVSRWHHNAKHRSYHPELRWIRKEGFGVHRTSVVDMYTADGAKQIVYVDLVGVKSSSEVRLTSLEELLTRELYRKFDVPLGCVMVRRVLDEATS